jgi:DNA helicase IV
MAGLVIIYILIALAGVGIWKYRKNQQIKLRITEFLSNKINEVENANSHFQIHTNNNAGFFSNYQLKTWKELHLGLFESLAELSSHSTNLTFQELATIQTFLGRFQNGDNIRNDFNREFIKRELITYKSFFDNIEGRELDLQQRSAIVTDEDNHLVIAGAGSGKTTTIVGKVKYILDRYKIPPEEILLISFTKNSASALANRINVKGIEAKTFHKLGKDILVATERKQPSIFDEAQFRPLVEKLFKDLLKEPEYLIKVTEYFTNYLKPVKSQSEFKNQGDYIQYLKDQNFRCYKVKEIRVQGKVTYKMEVVKSIEECRIANFLLFNGLQYEYEFPYEVETVTEKHRQYKPDFTIIQNGKKVYLEHFGISRDGKVPNWFSGEGDRTASEKYRDDMDWKRNIHKENTTTLIESYSYEMGEEILFHNLTTNLQNAGIVLEPKSSAEIWNIISDAASDEITNFVTLIQTFITLMKSNNFSIQDIAQKNKNTSSKYLRDRNSLFMEIIEPLYQGYEDHLAVRGEIDFSDMINKAAELISSNTYNRKISYLIIDEFQDISIGRYQLVKAIKAQNPSCKLFCVGDDWQSIYRFSGSDLALFKNFENYFGYSIRSRIETTYRFHDPLIKLSSDFILRNPNQTKKELKSYSRTKRTDYKIVYSESEKQDDTLALQNIFNELARSIKDIENKVVLILGRYGFDIDRIKNENADFQINKRDQIISYRVRVESENVSTPRTINAQFMTVHKSKGLEGDIVIMLNCNSGKLGFPSELSDDHVLDLLLSEADQFENGEERRLFYVAMTRGKEKVYLIADSAYKSKFIMELEVENEQSPTNKCPKCRTSDVILMKSGKAKNGNTYKFYGCLNYIYGCDYTKTEWLNN